MERYRGLSVVYSRLELVLFLSLLLLKQINFLCIKNPIDGRWFWKRSVFLPLLQSKFKFCFKLWLTSTFTSFWVHNSTFLIDRLSFRFSRNSAEIRVWCFLALEYSDFCLPSLLFCLCLLLEEQWPIALNETKLKKSRNITVNYYS